MSKYAFIHFAGKLPRNSKGLAAVAVSVCSDFEGYHVLTTSVRTVQNKYQNNKYTGLMALEEAFNFIFTNQTAMMNADITRVYLVTDSPITFSYLTKTTTNQEALAYMDRLFRTYSFGGPKELRVGVGVAELCFRNSAKSRCDLELLKETAELNEEIQKRGAVYCFAPDDNVRSIEQYIHTENIE